MKSKKALLFIGIILVCLPLFQFAQSSSNTDDWELKNFSQSIPLGKAQSVKALINVNGGELVVAGSTKELADVHFDYYDSYWNPSVSYTETPEQGKLIIKSNANFTDTKIKDKNNCTISLNRKVTYSLGIELGAGLVDLNFESYDIERALMRLGVGSFEINLANTNISLLKIEAGIGEAVINLSGERTNNLTANISAGIGEMTIIVPKNVGARFKISGFLGEINAPGFTKKNKIYTNAVYQDSEVIMEFDVSGAIGSINVLQQ